MTVQELMDGVVTDATYAGIVTANDMVLAINLADTPASDPNGYFVAQEGVTETTGSLEAQTAENEYIRTGKMTTKTGTSRSFSISGDRMTGDPFQDAALSHKMKYGTGQTVIKDYVYFNMLTGIGESGKISITVEDDLSGAAGENASFTMTCASTGTPVEYTYAQPTPATP